MSEEIIERFEVMFLSILDTTGSTDESLMPALSPEDITRIYELMVLSRVFDERALALQREGRIGTYAPIIGQEASQIGSAYAISNEDWIFPSFREMGVFITRGYPLHMLFQYWSGDERGAMSPEKLNIFSICVPVGTQVPHAAGAAMAAKYRGDRIAVICYFGDGGTSKGDFHEGLNMAGVFKLPVVFICQNNHWAISVPRERQTASKTLAQKAFAYGFEGVQVDGNDVFAVYKATREAIKKAKELKGPTLIECLTYRMGDHTTADDASRYRSKEEVEAWKAKDPITRLRLFMKKKGLWTEVYQREIDERSRIMVDEAVKMMESIQPPLPQDMFGYTFESPSQRQIKQLRNIGTYRRDNGKT